MWVWPSLGYDHVSPLPSASLEVMGRRCRFALGAESTSRELFSTSQSQSFALSTHLRTVRDEGGNSVEISTMPGPVGWRPSSPSAGSKRNSPVAAESSWRLQFISHPSSAAMPSLPGPGDVRVCVPGTVDLQPAPVPSVTSAHGNFATVKEAIKSLAASGGGTFSYQVPMVSARLREDISAECCELVAPDEWPYYITGAVMGGELEVFVTGDWTCPSCLEVQPAQKISCPKCSSKETGDCFHPLLSTTSLGGASRSHGSSRKATRSNVNSEAPDGSPVIVQGDGFQLRIVQRGGPPIDPARLHQKDEAVIGDEFDRWSRKPLTSRPGTWRNLHVITLPGATETGGLPQVDDKDKKRLMHSQTFGGTGLDVALAATATAEISLEPFELSYGDSHVASLKRMFEDEIADVLSIAPEQVMCGDFNPRGQGQVLKHIRQNSVLLRFALLHSEMVDVRGRETSKDVQVPKKMLPGRLNTLHSAQVEDLKDLSEALPSGSLLSKSRGSRVGSISMKRSSVSLPELTKGLPKSLSDSSRGLAITPPLSGEELNSELQPDLLLRKLMAALSERKHPMRRHPDVFPMLTRVLRGGIAACEMLVANRDLITPGAIAENLKEFMRNQRPRQKELKVDEEALRHLSMKRTDILSIETGADSERVAKVVEFRSFSPKELLDRMDSSLAIPADLAATLDVLIEMSESDADASGNPDQCTKLKFHNILERLNILIQRFKADRLTMFSCITIITNLTGHDIGCVDRILDKHLAPNLILVLGNFPKDHDMQVCGCKLLRRIYARARETSQHGPRIITLGKGLDEVWTFRGVDRILDSMTSFADDENLQFDACTMLVSLAELLYNNGKAPDTFERLSVAMTKHARRADILRCGVTIIARLGPAFLAYEHRGVRTIVDAMERHRSDVELQRAGARAFFSLAKTEDALSVSRRGGSIGAMLIAMFTHSNDPQVLQESTRALEKHCPIALSKVFHVNGDLATTLPPVFWRADPLDFSGKSLFDITGMKADWKPEMIESFLSDVLTHRKGAAPPEPGDESAAGHVGTGILDTLDGYRRLGLRDELDALDSLWALPGPPSTGLSVREAGEMSKQLRSDIEAIEKRGADGSRLLVPGPKDEQLKRLCEGLQQGTLKGRNGVSRWGAHDGELMVLLLGFYAWHSERYALKLIEFGAAKALVLWLRADHLKTSDVTKSADGYPLQRACLGAMASLCKHGPQCVDALLVEDAAPLVLNFTDYLDITLKRNAIRCVARMLPHTTQKQVESQTFHVPKVWDLIIRELAEKDDTIRTCAAACALEAAHNGWCSDTATETPPLEKLASSLIGVLLRSTPQVDEPPTALQSTGSLPVLLTLAYLVAEEPSAADVLMKNEALTRLLMRWLPAGSPDKATSVDKAAAAGAARTLEALSRNNAPLGADDMEALLRHGSSDSATSALRQACCGALEHAIQCEQNVEHLGQLFATRIRRAGGSERLAVTPVLRLIAERIKELLGSDIYRDCGPQDRLIKSLESAEPLLPKPNSEDGHALHQLVQEAKKSGGIDEGNKTVLPAKSRIMDDGGKTLLPGVVAAK